MARNCLKSTVKNQKKKWRSTHSLPEIMQPCTRKNKQWPSLSSVAKAILSWRPGLIFNSADFLWADPPHPRKKKTFPFPMSVSSTATRLWSCSDHREQRLIFLPATSLQTHTMLLKERRKKKQVGERRREGKKDNKIDLNIPHITKA